MKYMAEYERTRNECYKKKNCPHLIDCFTNFPPQRRDMHFPIYTQIVP